LSRLNPAGWQPACRRIDSVRRLPEKAGPAVLSDTVFSSADAGASSAHAMTDARSGAILSTSIGPWSGRPGVAVAVLVGLTVLRAVYAGVAELRTDEAYYWTWSQENVLSFLDHPPMVAWMVRLGTALFGDTAFGVRFGGLLAMAAAQLCLADIVRRLARDAGAVWLALLMFDAALYYGLFMAKVAPDVALLPFLLGMIWALVRLVETQDGRWWVAAGAFAGLAALSKLTIVFLLPAVAAFALVPAWRRRWLASPWPWLGLGAALVLFSPVLIWNAANDWASFRFQFVRAGADHGLSLRTFGDFLGVQMVMVGPVLLPVLLSAVAMTAWRGFRRREAAAILLSTAVLVPLGYFVWKSLSLRIGDTWPMFVWPPAVAAAAVNLAVLRREHGASWLVRQTERWIRIAIAAGLALVVAVFAYYTMSASPRLGRLDPVGKEAGYAAIAARAESELAATGATWIATTDYRTTAMLRWYLKDRVPVVQINERSRFIGFRAPDMSRIAGHAGLYVAAAGSTEDPAWRATTAVRTPVGEIEQRWRGIVIDRFVLEKITGWTPELTPPPTSPLYKWPALA
jgi:4-amino-4-deoxy-L-arabinose transferase-like glycosyltransferase